MSKHAKVAGAVFLFSSMLAMQPKSADAAGLYVADRGVRPMGRAGAFVAGADDAHAMWYNPAGLADAGTAVLVDAAWVNFSSEYRRKTQVTDASGTLRVFESPQVDGKTPVIPIPTIGATYNFGKEKQYTAGLGLFAPYAAIASYPLTLNGQPSPSRYSLVSLDGSTLSIVGGYFAYKPIPQIRIGGGVQAIFGTFASSVVFSASPSDRLIAAPEDPAYDALSQLRVGPIFAPSGNLGIIAEPDPRIRVGVSAQLPFWVNAPATVQVRLPTAAPFDKAYQDGDSARVRFRLPPVVRAGVEYRAALANDASLRLEVAYVREFWSLHDSIDIRSENVRLYDIAGFPSPFGVNSISIPRNFKDSNSFRGGFEYSIKDLIKDYRTDLRAGLAYETSGIPAAYVSTLTYDASKIIGGAGGSLHVGEHWRFDASLGIVLYDGVILAPGDARVPRVNPVRGNPTVTEAVNGGDYSARAVLLGVGVNYKF